MSVTKRLSTKKKFVADGVFYAEQKHKMMTIASQQTFYLLCRTGKGYKSLPAAIPAAERYAWELCVLCQFRTDFTSPP